jgi:hypothetical protein
VPIPSPEVRGRAVAELNVRLARTNVLVAAAQAELDAINSMPASLLGLASTGTL